MDESSPCKCEKKSYSTEELFIEEEEIPEDSTIIDDIILESDSEFFEDEEDVKEQSPYKTKRESHRDSRKLITPFFVRWSFGYASNVPIVNLCRPGEKLIAFANTHFVAIRPIEKPEKREAFYLKGHTNVVRSISTDIKGEWLASVDSGENNGLIVWNRMIGIPVFSQFNFCSGGSAAVGLSPDAKYLITASLKKPYTVQIWLWTYGKTSPDDVYLLSQTISPSIKSINFNQDISEHFMLTSDDDIFFMSWDGNKLNLMSIPEIIGKKKNQFFLCSTYVSGTHLAMSSTTLGTVFVWSDVEYCYAFDNKNVENKKFLIKVMKLENCAITSILNCDGHIVTGSIKGHIRFYDLDLKLLHWLDKFIFPGLTCISPDIKPEFMNYTGCESNSTNKNKEDEGSEYQSSTVFEGTITSDILHKPFFSRNFVIGLETGEIGQINFLEDTYTIFKQGGGSVVKSIEVHPKRIFLIIGYTEGEIAVFNYRSRERFFFRQLIIKEPKGISCLKFEPQGYFLIVGGENGSIYLLHSCTLEKLHPRLNNTTHEIKQIEFTPDSEYIAISDKGKSISLYHVKSINEAQITFLGRIKPHYKEINCIIFVPNIWDEETKYKLMSIGDDRALITYDINGSISIRWFERIEQSALPKYLSYQEINGKKRLILCNDQFKFRMLFLSNRMCYKTLLGPKYSTPVNKFFVMSKNDKPNVLLFYTKTHIGIQKYPLTGNPFDNVALIGHPVEILQGCPNSNYKRFFTFGPLSSEVIMWQVNTRSVDVMSKLGGQGLSPFYNLIEGGESGWLFQEIIEFFYFGQILHQGKERESEREVSDLLPICELSEVMSAIGFFPSKYEYGLMTYEIMYENHLAGREKNRINFEDLVRLYINHRPANGITKDQLLNACKEFGFGDQNPILDLESLIDTLETEGESIGEGEIKGFFNFLYKRPTDFYGKGASASEPFADFDNLPSVIYYSEFEERILGIDWDFKKITEEYKKSQSEK